MRKLIILLLASSISLLAQTPTATTTYKPPFDYVGPFAGSPGNCSQGRLEFITDATVGQNLYLCTSTNTWTQFIGGAAAVSSVFGRTGAVTGQLGDYGFPDLNGLIGLTQLDPAVAVWKTPGAGAPIGTCTAGLHFYEDTTNFDVWFCSATNTWRKILSTTNTGVFALTVNNGTNPCGTVSAGTDCISFNSTDNFTVKTSAGSIKTVLDTNSINASGSANLGPVLPVNVFTSHIASGNQDLYTPAAGRKAVVTTVYAYNDSAGTPTAYAALKIGGTYYPIASDTATMTANTGTGYPINAVLDSTTTLAFNTGTGSVVNVEAVIMEFDANVPLSSVYTTTFNAGTPTTLYTVTAAKKGCLLTTGPSVNIPNLLPGSTGSTAGTAVAYWNASGGTRTVTVNFVPSGGSVATTNLVINTPTVANRAAIAKAMGTCLNAGDFVSLTTDAATATQIAWVTRIELP